MSYDGNRALWCEVLALAISDALDGIRGVHRDRLLKVRAIEAARRYIIEPNHDFNFVCTNAGIDPEVVRERLAKQITDAPTPEQLVEQNGRPATNKFSVRRERKHKQKPRTQGPGVVSDFERDSGTGAGRSAQDSPNISFSKECA
ncbi:MAG: hypothetical protein RID23_19555 [Roseovarius sp.]